MQTLFSTRRAIEFEQFHRGRPISAGHRLLDEAVGAGSPGALWVVRGPLRERSSIIDSIAAASLLDRRSITYVSLHRPSSEVGLRVVAVGAETSAARLVDGSAGERADRAVELSENRVFDVIGTDVDLVDGLRHATPPWTGRPLDLLIVDGIDLAPTAVVSALGVDDYAHGAASWTGATRHYARRYATTVVVGTGEDVRSGRPDPDIGDHDVLIDVGWFDEAGMAFPVAVTSGRFIKTRLLASWMPHRSGLAWHLMPDRT